MPLIRGLYRSVHLHTFVKHHMFCVPTPKCMTISLYQRHVCCVAAASASTVLLQPSSHNRFTALAVSSCQISSLNRSPHVRCIQTAVPNETSPQQQQTSSASGSGSSSYDHDSPEERKKRVDKLKRNTRWTVYFFAGFAGLYTAVLFYYYGMEDRDELGNKIPDEFSNLTQPYAALKRVLRHLSTMRTYVVAPSRDVLLPDPVKYPYYQPKYTLVVEMNDVLVHPEWTYQTGWRFKKRPAVEYFLRNRIDLLNRDLRRVIVIDWDPKANQKHPENVLLVPRWNGRDDDTSLVDLAELLKVILASDEDDVRPVVQMYSQCGDPAQEFRRRSLEFRHQQQPETTESDAESAKKSGFAAQYAGKLFGFRHR